MGRNHGFASLVGSLVASLVAALAAGCGFDAPLTGDGGPPTNVTVAFETATTQADEKIGTVAVDVVLSEPATTPITVDYEIAGGTATPATDFQTLTASRLTFAPNETRQRIELAIVEDNVAEDDETIELVLASPTGATLGRKTHEIAIAANALPRVKFAVVTSMADEPTDAMLEVTLTEMSSFAVSVDYVLEAGTATEGSDYALAAGTLTIAPNTLAQSIALDVLQDALDEDPETVVVTLQTSQNAVIDDAAKTRTHTIVDEDPEPNVAFAAASATVNESAGTVDVTVQLAVPSGRAVTVPFTLDAASSATGTADFTIGTTSPLTIPAGQTTATIAVTIVNDTADEPAETVVLALGTPTNAVATAPTTHTLSIADDDLVCYGPANSERDVCFDSPPQGTETLPASINTSNSPLCAATQPVGWTAAQDAACVIARDTINVTSNVTVTGNRPLVLVAASAMTINAMIDAASHVGGTSGPGTPSPDCKAFLTTPGGGSGGGGGAGASFMTIGGAGGTGNDEGRAGGTPPAADAAAPAKLRTGCTGQRGGNAGTGSSSGAAGRGGGAVYLVSGGTLSFGNSGGVNVSGAGAGASGNGSGGSGAGSGGMLDIFAAGMLSTGNTTKLVANGGGGGSGGANTVGGAAGQDPSPAAYEDPAIGGTGTLGGGDGGNGFAGVTAATGGSAGEDAGDGGGGGGGGGGFLRSNQSLGGADVSAGSVVVVP